MTPKSFDIATSRHMVGDERARKIESDARMHADAAELDSPGAAYSPPPAEQGRSYWEGTQGEFARQVYHHAFQKRIERRMRKASTNGAGQ